MQKLSIVIPVYNTAIYLKECLESIINQTYSEIEIICVDDCSPDNSAEIIKEYAAKDSSFIERWLFFPYDPADEAYRIEMQYGKLYQFSQISTGMERVLAKLLQLLEICDRIRLIRAICDAKRGKTAAVADTRDIAG